MAAAGTASVAEDLTAALRADISGLDAELHRWVKGRHFEVSSLESTHDAEMAEFAATKAQLESRRAELQEAKYQYSQLRSEQEGEVETLLSEIQQLRVASKGLPERVAALSGAEAAEKARLETLRAELEQAAELRQTERNDLTRGVLLYKRLGLDFERALDDRLRLTFTQIDRREPGRPFSFCVHVDESNVYHISACEPALADRVVTPMLERLNADNNFGAFVCGMRHHFVALVQ